MYLFVCCVLQSMLLRVLCHFCCSLFFFFQQNTSYEMRISYWSSDGCSSDLIAFGIGFPGLHDREIGAQPGLPDIERAFELLDRLALGHHRADARLRVEGGDAGPAGTNSLGKRALRIEFKVELPGQVELGEQLVLPDIGRDHLPDLPVVEQGPQAKAIRTAIVRDDRQFPDRA